MAVIKLNQMGGIHPSVLPRNLPPDGAQIAQNLNPGTNEFRPLKQDTLVSTVLNTSNPQTLYRFDRNADGTLNTSESTGWIGSGQQVSLVRQQLNDDTTGRIYYTNDTGSTDLGLRWIDPTGADRPASVPFPTTKLGVALNDGYVFTPELKAAELNSALQAAVSAANDALTPTLVGLGNTVGETSGGWIRASDIGGPQLEVIRVFAVNPSTNAIIATYSSMPVSEASWVLDPSLGGFYSEAPVGYTPPTWATGHTKWWCLPMRGFARAFGVNQSTLTAALAALDMPGTQGAEKLLTGPEVAAIVARFVDLADPAGTVVSDLVKKLERQQAIVADYANRGGAATLEQAIAAYFASTPVTDELASAKDVFAEKIWSYVERIATAQDLFDVTGGEV
jgi:hypothetical protein